MQKLAWFLQRIVDKLKLPDPLDLRFTASKYGPYAERLRHLLDALDGSFLHCEKRLSDAGPFDLIWFEDAKRPYLDAYLHTAEAKQYQPALELAASVIEGFESPLGMELLATVDWLRLKGRRQPDVEDLRRGLAAWPGGPVAAQRKGDDRMLRLAIDQLNVLAES